MRNTFKAYERLKREQHIDTLFRTGKAFSVFPFKVVYRMVDREEKELSPVRIGFSIPKKRFRKAVQRNRIKRLAREVWRFNKAALYETIPPAQQLHIFLIFTSTELPEISLLDVAIKKIIDKLIKSQPGS